MRSLAAPHDADDYGRAFALLFPTGPAWPQDEDTTFQRVVRSLAAALGDLDARACALINIEADPRLTLEMLGDWERAYGLPDTCVAEPQTIPARRAALIQKMTLVGEQSRPFFIGLATGLGYRITISEFSPFMAGVSRVGDTRAPVATGDDYRWRIGGWDMRFAWRVNIVSPRLSWFRVGTGGGQVGVDPHLRIGQATDLECVLRRYKPAHTDLIFNYSGIGVADPMAGTP